MNEKYIESGSSVSVQVSYQLTHESTMTVKGGRTLEVLTPPLTPTLN